MKKEGIGESTGIYPLNCISNSFQTLYWAFRALLKTNNISRPAVLNLSPGVICLIMKEKGQLYFVMMPPYGLRRCLMYDCKITLGFSHLKRVLFKEQT